MLSSCIILKQTIMIVLIVLDHTVSILSDECILILYPLENASANASGLVISDVPEITGWFRSIKHPTPSHKWPSWGWSNPSLCPDGSLATMFPLAVLLSLIVHSIPYRFRRTLESEEAQPSNYQEGLQTWCPIWHQKSGDERHELKISFTGTCKCQLHSESLRKATTRNHPSSE